MKFDLIIFKNLRERDKSEAIRNLIEDSTPRQEFYVLTSIATGIATIGLITDNITVVIGSMLLAPLLFPIIAFGLGVSLHNLELVERSIRSFLISTFFAFVLSAVLTILLGFDQTLLQQNSIIHSIEPSFAYTIVAFLSGFGAALAYAKPKLNISLTGVAISVAILPPLAASGIGFVIGNVDLFLLTFAQYIINVIVIAIASWLVFIIMHFDTRETTAGRIIDEEQEEVEEEHKLASKNSKKKD